MSTILFLVEHSADAVRPRVECQADLEAGRWQEPMCAAKIAYRPGDRWFCTRLKDHRPPHIASNMRVQEGDFRPNVLARWTED